MNDRYFRLALGLALLIGLYFELAALVLLLIVLLAFEGLTNLRLCRAFCPRDPLTEGAGAYAARIPFDAERALRLLVALFLFVGYVLYPQHAWGLTWLVGFALVGAGMSGICPMVLALRGIGFR
ncbi:DUF2892 domain-containing protein [Ectothiorhodospiraceae bacterium 2226]|nr:DUF2892 domain-containing protein [Ectothiorhodospiraceae bacterium 2226]